MRRFLWFLTLSSIAWAQPTDYPQVEVSGYFTAGQYSAGGSSDGLSEYLQIHLEGDSKVYLGHNQTRYRQTGAFADGVRQDLFSVGGVARLDADQYLVLDLFQLRDNRDRQASMFSLEYDRIVDPSLTVGVGLNHSLYPEGFHPDSTSSGYTVQQIVPRVIWWPDPSLCLNSRLYVTASSLTRTRVCLSEKLSYFPSPDWELQAGGVLGSSLQRIDNDTSTIYTQPQIQNGSWFLGVNFHPDADLKLTLLYERAFFQGYQVGYLSGGASVRF